MAHFVNVTPSQETIEKARQGYGGMSNRHSINLDLVATVSWKEDGALVFMVGEGEDYIALDKQAADQLSSAMERR